MYNERGKETKIIDKHLKSNKIEKRKNSTKEILKRKRNKIKTNPPINQGLLLIHFMLNLASQV